LYKADVYEHAKGMKFVVAPRPVLTDGSELDAEFAAAVAEYKEAFGSELYLGASRAYRGDDGKQLYRLAQLGKRLVLPMIATNDVYYHAAERRPLQDVLTCIREKCTIQNAGFRLFENAERFLKPIDEMERLFRQYPGRHPPDAGTGGCLPVLARLAEICPIPKRLRNTAARHRRNCNSWPGKEPDLTMAMPSPKK